jgi:hypothetical protein
MADHQGIDANDIADSIQNAKDFIKELDIEPYTHQHADLTEDARTMLQAVVSLQFIMQGGNHLENLTAGLNENSFTDLFNGVDDKRLISFLSDDMCQKLVQEGMLSYRSGRVIDCKKIIEAQIDKITDADIQAIRDAESDEDLKAVMSEMNAPLLVLSDLFERHGYLDTQGKGTSVVLDVHAWSGFDGSKPIIPSSVREAIDLHLIYYSEPTPEQEQAFFEKMPQPDVTQYSAVLRTYGNREAALMMRDEVAKVILPFTENDEPARVHIIPARTSDPAETDALLFDTTVEGALAVSKALPSLKIVNNMGQTVGDNPRHRPDPNGGFDSFQP